MRLLLTKLLEQFTRAQLKPQEYWLRHVPSAGWLAMPIKANSPNLGINHISLQFSISSYCSGTNSLTSCLRTQDKMRRKDLLLKDECVSMAMTHEPVYCTVSFFSHFWNLWDRGRKKTPSNDYIFWLFSLSKSHIPVFLPHEESSHILLALSWDNHINNQLHIKERRVYGKEQTLQQSWNVLV